MKLTIEIINAKINDNGGLLLSKEYKNNYTKLKIKCKYEHIFYITYANITLGKWCAECYFDRLKLKYYMIKDNIENKGGILLSNEYKNNSALLKIKCENNHIFKKKFKEIKAGQWCAECSFDKKRLKIDYVISFIESKCGILLSKEYKNNHTKLKIKCHNAHIFYSRFNDIKDRNRWCPECNISNSQQLLFNNLSKIFLKEDGFNLYQNYKGFEWLKNKKTGRRQEIDIFISNGVKAIAVEYDGEQHFKPVYYFSNTKREAIDKFNKIKELDKNKSCLIKQHKNDIQCFIRFNYKEDITDLFLIKKKIFK